jgi:hypothetical protein
VATIVMRNGSATSRPVTWTAPQDAPSARDAAGDMERTDVTVALGRDKVVACT